MGVYCGGELWGSLDWRRGLVRLVRCTLPASDARFLFGRGLVISASTACSSIHFSYATASSSVCLSGSGPCAPRKVQLRASQTSSRDLQKLQSPSLLCRKEGEENRVGQRAVLAFEHKERALSLEVS